MAPADLLKPSTIRFSPLDTLTIVRITTLVLVWKFLSVDYTAFADLLKGPDLYPVFPSFLLPFIRSCDELLFDWPQKIQLLQITAALFLLAGAILVSRLPVLLGVLLVMLFESTAGRYRGPLYDTELPTVLLLLTALWPRRWSTVLSDNAALTGEATELGLCLVTYVAGAYFLAGLSKLTSNWRWWTSVRLDLLYPAIVVGHGITLPAYLDYTARLFHAAFSKWPLLENGAALLSLAFELLWPLALVSRFARLTLPLGMLGTHLIIFLSSGLLFLPMAVTALASVVPWRRIIPAFPRCRDPGSVSRPVRTELRGTWDLSMRSSVGLAAALVLLSVPAVNRLSYPPLLDYHLFGFNYSAYDHPVHLYRLGYLGHSSEHVALIPMNYGGFFDYQFVTNPGTWIEAYVRARGADDELALRDPLLQFVRAIRPPDSHRWLLGFFAAPTHIVSQPVLGDRESLGRVVLLEGDRQLRDGRVSGEWRVLAELNGVGR